MKAGTATASIVRRIGGLAKASIVTAVIAATMLAPATVSAASRTVTPKIALASTGTARTAAPALGTYIHFDTVYPTTVKNPRIEVLCYQDGRLVFGMAGGVTYEFLLGGGGSIWLDVGGAAHCDANLYYFAYRQGKQTYKLLASTGFDASA
jgi:hypothetical protein